VSANHILQNFLSTENFPEWKWALPLKDIVDGNFECIRNWSLFMAGGGVKNILNE
jgi:hypothetical protein